MSMSNFSSKEDFQVSPEAIEQFKKFQGKAGVRLGLKKSGCGWKYDASSVDSLSGEDHVLYSQDGIKLVVASEHFDVFKNIQIDYIKNGVMGGELIFRDPTAHHCGCGKSRM